MLPVNCGSHADYQNFVVTNLRKYYYPNPNALARSTWDIIERFWNFDLSFTDTFMTDKYSKFLHGECYSPVTIRNTFRKLMIQAGIPIQSNGKYPRIHDLRHTFAVHSLEQSIDQGLDPYCSIPALSIYTLTFQNE